MPKVIVYTQVYNTKPYLEQCISSVLSQTYTNFEYLLVDNGCTDGSSTILENFVKQDTRLHLIRYEKNQKVFWTSLIKEKFSGGFTYFTMLDSDDWWEANYLERLVSFAETNHLDIACTGTCMHNMEIYGRFCRDVKKPLILKKEDFATEFPLYHAFFRTVWGKLIKVKLICALSEDKFPKLPYGRDTLFCFYYLRHAQCIGIDNSVLHHYRIHKKSVSHQYRSGRLDADIYLYNDAIDFLKSYGPISIRNQTFLYIVYANAIRYTMGIILNAKLTPAEKIHEYAAIAVHPITQMAYRCSDTACRRSRETLLALICAEGLKLAAGEDDEDLQRALQVLLPRCGPAATGKNLPVFLSSELKKKFLSDDRDGVVDTLLNLLPQIPNLQKYDLGTAMGRLAADKLLLFQISDLTFLMKYPDLYRLIWMGENDQALDQMTGDLLDGQVLHAKETFLNLYINLAAHQGQESAFLFGKIQLAQFYCKRRRWVEAIQVLDDLEEMGAGELEEVHDLRTVLEEEKVQ